MGTSHSYECTKCKKQVRASLIETDGRSSKVLAVKCHECNEVSDSVIENRMDWNDEVIKQEPSCEECGSKNVTAWDVKCPKCGNTMNDTNFSIMWD